MYNHAYAYKKHSVFLKKYKNEITRRQGFLQRLFYDPWLLGSKLNYGFSLVERWIFFVEELNEVYAEVGFNSDITEIMFNELGFCAWVTINRVDPFCNLKMNVREYLSHLKGILDGESRTKSYTQDHIIEKASFICDSFTILDIRLLLTMHSMGIQIEKNSYKDHRFYGRPPAHRAYKLYVPELSQTPDHCQLVTHECPNDAGYANSSDYRP
ncbi:hypothetical protein C2G38_2213196 [Gigaspora rosea]|uniref:Uncharacterized protein n=1 Tax=Gigaspora rosea TaxID=44941 RepID=A0A397UL47_9GLOM|nr:hypothetical protein C2G38_2213196 [Gigaspora rosea]